MKFKTTTRLLIVSFFIATLFMTSVQADIVEMTDGKKAYGQFIALSQDAVFIETIVKSQRSLQTIPIPRNKVKTITDETGKVLFSDNETQVSDILVYENVIRNNWEELKQRFKKSTHDSLFLINGEKYGGRIISITEEAVFLEKPDTEQQQDKAHVSKYQLKQIRRINGEPVIFVDPSRPVRSALKKTEYPVYSINAGLAYIQSGYDELQGLFQDYYNDRSIAHDAAKRRSEYLGIQMKLEMLLQPYLSLGLTAHYFDYPKINSLGMTMAEVKYILYKIPMRPWLALGVAGQDFSSSEKISGTTYALQTRKSTISLGLGIDSGDEIGYGFTLSAHYLPFGKEKTKIDETNELLTRKINFSMIMISLGARFNVN